MQAIQEEFALRRKQFKKVKLSWRAAKGTRRALSWIPFKASAIKHRGDGVQFCGQLIKLWDSYGLSAYELGAGSFSEDSRGRGYLNITVKVKPRACKGTGAVGIDLGLKDFLTTATATE